MHAKIKCRDTSCDQRSIQARAANILLKGYFINTKIASNLAASTRQQPQSKVGL